MAKIFLQFSGVEILHWCLFNITTLFEGKEMDVIESLLGAVYLLTGNLTKSNILAFNVSKGSV